MKKDLVAYFSASGVTAGLAKRLASAIGADVYEIRPVTPYSERDLDWTNPASRSSIEMKDKSYRPQIIVSDLPDAESYDRIFVGFPIWWYVAPTVVNTFLESLDLDGKTVIPFATSGSSGMGDTAKELIPSCKGATVASGKRFSARASEAELKSWAESV